MQRPVPRLLRDIDTLFMQPLPLLKQPQLMAAAEMAGDALLHPVFKTDEPLLVDKAPDHEKSEAGQKKHLHDK